MDSDRAGRRRTIEVPSKPESGLAEWTSKIKALQRQVDEDEEAEHRRLEEEITASRLARLRRSTGSRANSVDLSTSDVAATLKNIDAPNLVDPSRSRQQNQDDAMKKLTGTSVHDPPASVLPAHQHRVILQPHGPAPSGTSLAAFMGGKAVGPRLTRHAPQQDAHDPTQFQQRTTVSTPHPIFGRGGVAMPGMVSEARGSVSSPQSKQNSTFPSSQEDLPARDRTTSFTPAGVRSIVARVEEKRSVSPHKSASYEAARQRTMSTPTGLFPSQRSPTTPTLQPKPDIPRPVSRSPAPRSPVPAISNTPLRPTTPNERPKALETLPSPKLYTTPPARGSSIPPPKSPGILSPKSPSFLPPKSPGIPPTRSPSVPPTFASGSSPSSKSPIVTPSLSRAVQPQPRRSFGGPQLSVASSASASFLRPPAEKEPTPSISRLQGRGFVQNMVKANSQISSASTSNESSVPRTTTGAPPTPDPAKKSSVLDRWQFENGKGGSGPSPPIISPKPVTVRKSRTFDAMQSSTASNSPAPTPFLADAHDRLRTKPSLPSISYPGTPNPPSARLSSSKSDVGSIPPYQRPKTPAGSSTTMISYMKPTKTGDNPPVVSAPSTPALQSRSVVSPVVDEMGVRVRPRAKSISAGASEEGGQSQVREPSAGGDEDAMGRPLSHPTKDRAKKPRKAKIAAKEVSFNLDPAQEERTASHQSFRPQTSISSAVPPRSRTQGDLGRADSPTSSPTNREQTEDLEMDVRQSVSTPSGTPPTRFTPPKTSQSPPSWTPPSTSTFGVVQHAEKAVPSSKPIKKHHRIPSTGNRALVMDVAQAFEEHAREPSVELSISTENDSGNDEAGKEQPSATLPVEDPASSVPPEPRERNGVASPARMEQRRSSYDKYSAFIMPALTEETTPIQSPAGTLTRQDLKPQDLSLDQLKAELHMDMKVASQPAVVPAVAAKHVSLEHTSVLTKRPDDEPLPRISIENVLAPDIYEAPSDVQSISVDVMSIAGTAATSITRDHYIFYDTELLVIVHRFKAKGLVSTTVWSWRGKKNEHGEKEERKVQELVRRYNTSLVTVKQYGEPAALITVLGGQLAIRQGTRAHWSRENTAMHSVRSSDGLVFIDEVELGSRSLCSGYSYCLSLLETFYVWYGQGSVPAEREAALKYAQALAQSQDAVVELSENDNDADEIFWMMLGESEYANADYWKWRPSLRDASPRIWRLEDRTDPATFQPVISLSTEDNCHDHIFLADCKLEYFVLVGQDARGSRKRIRLALSAALDLAKHTKKLKPFSPPAHVLVFPSQVPQDLRLTFRDLDVFDSEQSPYPDHMNLVSTSEALEHLHRTSWERSSLKDVTMLPLGIHPSDL
ncbi:hypothetical protein EIP91_009250 [Steccherinum ochraceum]|uniref:DUF7904 domain-containing protein n=1 Tax=Steccherinum ochraceum TaxID=92696 RepID=A0A4R0RA13_9APHY|nr:hypothetical protein EIP91_009250 [Steccherinum ochraceum]